MSRERDFLDIARVNLRVAAKAVELAHAENPERGSLGDIARDIHSRRMSCAFVIDVIDQETAQR